MTIRAISADGVAHDFPDNTKQAIIDTAMKRYAVTQKLDKGPLGASESAQRGFVAGVLGTPGDIESLGRSALNLIPGVNVSSKTVLPTISRMEDILPGHNLEQMHPTAETVGEFLPAAVPLGGAVKAAAPLAQAVSRSTNIIGDVADHAALGSKIIEHSVPGYDRLFAEREAALEKAAPARSYIDANESQRALLTSRRMAVYNSKKFEPLRKLEDSLRRVEGTSGELVKGSSGANYKVSPEQMLKRIFSSSRGLEDMADILHTTADDPAVDHVASEYAATSLRDATEGKNSGQALDAARAWRRKNAGWLNKTRITKGAVDTFINRLSRRAAVTAPARYALHHPYYIPFGLGGLYYLWKEHG